MPLGVIACDRVDTDTVCADLTSLEVDFLRLGALPSMTVMTFPGPYRAIDLSRLPEGRIPKTVGEVLAENAIDRVVNAGSLNGLLHSIYAGRVKSRRGADGLRAVDRKRNALCLESLLRDLGIGIAWLKDLAPSMLAGEGVLNDVDPPVAEIRRAAFLRAASNAARERVACAWIDNGLEGVAAYDTDEHLMELQRSAFPQGPLIMVKIATRLDHSPIDPPLIGVPTINLARKANVGAILIDATRGVISSREETLSQAQQAGIAIIGVRPPQLLP